MLPHKLGQKLELQFKSDPTIQGICSEKTEEHTSHMSPQFNQAYEDVPLDSLREDGSIQQL